MAVAIAGDNNRREYWFGNESRSRFVYISFLLLILPGIVSIGGLIPINENKIPSWPFGTLFFGLIYFGLAITFSISKRKLDDPEEFKKLERNILNVTWEMGVDGFVMIVSSVLGIMAMLVINQEFYSGTETAIGIWLLLSVFTSAINSIVLLRTNDISDKRTNTQTQSKYLKKTQKSKGRLHKLK